MSKLKGILFFLLISINIFAQQGINNQWLLGYASWGGYPFGINRFDFYNGIPQITADSLEMEFRHTEATIADSAGNLLFYTNGFYIADATNDTMQNGGGINPSAYTTYFSDGLGIPQADVIIPKPGSSNLYYLFHSTVDTFPGYTHSKHLYYSVIDMNLHGGLGAVTLKNQILLTDSMNAGKLAMCKHANGRDWWLICHKLNSNRFFKFLILPNAILGPYTQDIGNIKTYSAGQAVFSPDGKKFAQYWKNFNGTGNFEIFDFDRCNGTLSNFTPINSVPYENSTQVGLAFSPNSQLLYVSNVYHVYQFDIIAPNVSTTQTTVATYDGFLSVPPNCPGCPSLQTGFSPSALAPDGKIYITTGNGTVHLHTIDSPDVVGVGCMVNQHSVQVPRYYFNTLPNHPNYFLGCDTSGCTTCLTALNNLKYQGAALHASPNPSTGNFTLQFNVKSIAGTLAVYDIMGNVVFNDYVAAWSQFKKINIAHLATGIYVCKLNRGSETEIVKVVKE